ncbi:MAG: tRNA lysidine(34) synthetase TilS [Armatimonadota bacterium]
MDLLTKVRDTIKAHCMAPPGSTVVVAVSGGADSSALLLALSQLREELGIAIHVGHLHHGLRGQDAEEDLLFVQNLASQLGIRFTAGRADVPAEMKRHRISEELAGRRARYAFLCSLARSIGADRIATGHTADDQAETVLMRVIRGTGTEGIAGIPPVGTVVDPEEGTPITVVRPLIAASRAEAVDFCRAHGVEFRTDPCNLKPDPLRNRVRLELIPLLQEGYNSGVILALTRLADVAREENSLLEHLTDEVWQRAVDIDTPTELAFRLCDLPQHRALLRRLVRRALLRLNPDHVPHYSAVERVVRGAEAGHCARFDIEGGLCADVCSGRLRLRVQPPLPQAHWPT